MYFQCVIIAVLWIFQVVPKKIQSLGETIHEFVKHVYFSLNSCILLDPNESFNDVACS